MNKVYVTPDPAFKPKKGELRWYVRTPGRLIVLPDPKNTGYQTYIPMEVEGWSHELKTLIGKEPLCFEPEPGFLMQQLHMPDSIGIVNEDGFMVSTIRNAQEDAVEFKAGQILGLISPMVIFTPKEAAEEIVTSLVEAGVYIEDTSVPLSVFATDITLSEAKVKRSVHQERLRKQLNIDSTRLTDEQYQRAVDLC